MNDDAPSTGTPDPAADSGAAPPPPPPGSPVPPAFQPDKTVMRKPEPSETVMVPPSGTHAGGAHAGPPAEQSAEQAGQPDQPFVYGAFSAPDADQSGGPSDPDFPTAASKAGITGAIVALGTGLLGAAVVISAIRSRDTSDGELDWSNYGIGLGATAVLLLVALLGSVAARRRTGGRAREEVVTWPGTVGILATAVVVNVGIDTSEDWLGYLTGAILVVLGALGYVAARRAAFVVVAILGLAIIYGLAFDDFVADSVGDGHPEVTAAVLVAVFVVVVTLLGWALPSRAVTGVVVGTVAVAAYAGILGTFAVSRYLTPFFADMFGTGMLDTGESSGVAFEPTDIAFDEADVWWVLAFAAVLTILWALAAAVSNHSGFAILAILMPVIAVPLASVALAAEHPSRWSAAVAVAGAVLLLGAIALARVRGKKVAAATW